MCRKKQFIVKASKSSTKPDDRVPIYTMADARAAAGECTNESEPFKHMDMKELSKLSVKKLDARLLMIQARRKKREKYLISNEATSVIKLNILEMILHS